MPNVSNCGQPGRRTFVRFPLLAPFAYQAIALLCLRHWKSAAPWQDLDFFSGAYFVLAVLPSLYKIRFKRGIFESRETLREASGLSYDPVTVRWGSLLAVGELSVFLDYGHWRLMPPLRQPGLQITGLVVYACALAALMWTDSRLVRHFQEDQTHRQVMTTGPFALVRHPRYASLLLAKLGLSLLFASIFAWFSLLVSIFLIRRRIGLEETHLHEVFGSRYSSYAEHTRRLFPGIY
jgi:protein-S-isoprenylcysteine O-methyltransferase Ste14